MSTPLFDSIVRDFELGHQLSQIAQRALLETSAGGVAVALMEGTECVCRATAGVKAPTIGVRLQNDTGITAACIRSGQAVICSDASSDERVNAAACQVLGIASIVVVPIRSAGTVIGIVEALSEKNHAFGAADQAVLERIAYEIEQLAPGQLASLEDGATSSPDFAALMTLIEAERETPIEANEGDAVVAPEPFPGNDKKRVSWRAAGIAAPLAICVLFLAALFLAVGPLASHPTSVAEQPVPLSTLPLRRARFLEPSPAIAGRDRVAEKHSANSLEELESSARAGDTSAQVRLANALESGAGVTPDPVAAEAWYIVAGLAGSTEATNGMRALSRRLSNPQVAAVREQLATMYWQGIGVKRDPIAAYSWLTLAEAAGAQDVGARKLRMARTMGHSQIEEANLRAQQWLKQHHQLIAQNTNN